MNNNNSTRRQPKAMERYFTKEDIQKANKHMKRCSVSLSHQGNTDQNHSEIPTYTVTTPNATKDAKKLDYLHTAGGNVKWYRHSEKKMELSLKTKHATKTCLGTVLVDIYPKETKALVHTKPCTFLQMTSNSTPIPPFYLYLKSKSKTDFGCSTFRRYLLVIMAFVSYNVSDSSTK